MKIGKNIALVLLVLIVFQMCKIKNPKLTSVIIGTYTQKENHVDGKAEGILRLTQNNKSTKWETETLYKITNPSFLCISQKGIIYTVSETNNSTSSYLYSLQKIQDQYVVIDSIQTHGQAACHVALNEKENKLVVSNYLGGTVSLFRTQNGKLSLINTVSFQGNGTHPRQDSSHPHMGVFSENDAFVFIADLGSNKIWMLSYNNEWEKYEPYKNQEFIRLPPNSGPRHLTFHQNKIYCLNELNSSISLIEFDNSSGKYEVSNNFNTLENTDYDTEKNLTAEITFHPNGQFLYVSNRGHNSISVFRVEKNGQLQWLQNVSSRGEIPRHIAIHPNQEELWVANQNSDTIVIFHIDKKTGNLNYKTSLSDIKTPVCIVFGS